MLKTLDLNGDWKIRWSDGVRGRMEYSERPMTDERKYIAAKVPGEVHWDLFKAGVIPDPYIGTNCLASRWVEEMVWSYRREFTVPQEALKGRAWLYFVKMDLTGIVVLNGKEVGRHNNFFRPCRLEVTGKLKPGKNLLTVHVESGIINAADKPSLGYVDRAFFDIKLHKRHWLRKPQCEFGWDWSQRFINVGLQGPVSLEYSAESVRLDQMVVLSDVSPDLKKGKARVRLFVEGLVKKTQKAQLEIGIAGSKKKVKVALDIKPGLQACEAVVEIDKPKLWWPVGHGKQPLYKMEATLRLNGKTLGAKAKRFGFRRLVVNQQPHPQKGNYFILEVNNKKIFAKGGNFVPADMIMGRLDKPRYQKLVSLALEANFNMLRVWGGGLYESCDFYDLCDEKGVLVWQEFIFACGRYPNTDEEFHNNVKAEAIYQIRRLASHPSLVVWCGNNENEMGSWDWGFDKGVVHPDYALYHLTLPRLLAQEDPTRFYQPSSPFSMDHQNPTLDETGDQHPWSVGFGNTDFRDYRKMVCRFPNEGGILGPTALPTMKACLTDSDGKIASMAWQVHDNSVDSWGEPSFIDSILPQWLGKDIRKMSVDEYAYWGGLIQGEGLREYCDNFRRRMFDCSSAIFWMYNDTWPAVRSWTIVDYYLRRTPSFMPVKRALASVNVVVAQEEDNTIAVYGINETAVTVKGKLRYGVFNIAGGYPVDKNAEVTLLPNASTKLASFSRAEWKNIQGSAAFAMLLGPKGLVARSRLFLPLFKDLKWVPAKVTVRMEKGQAVFESSTFVWGVCLDLDGETPLCDNFFDVYPGIPYKIVWKAKNPPQILRTGNLC